LKFSLQVLHNWQVSFGRIKAENKSASNKGENQMKKTVLIVALVLVAIAVLGAGVAFAQGQQPPAYGGMMGRGGGWMHDYVEKALADKLGLTEAQVEKDLAAGKTMYQIAVDAGTAEADVPALLTEIHTAAFDKAVADGVVTREQADWMLQRMQGRYGAGGATGTCPMHNGTYGPNGGQGYRGGPGGGMMGGRWLNQ
jgi:Spy/CpxP family protein refolding chaperone